MNPEEAPIPIPERPLPIYRRTDAERYQHVALRMKERGGIDWTLEQVEKLEKKIKAVRVQAGSGKEVTAILPTKIAESPDKLTQHYRVMIGGVANTVIWSVQCKGLVSYIGKGEIKERLQ